MKFLLPSVSAEWVINTFSSMRKQQNVRQLRAHLEQRICGGILYENVPVERNGIDAFGTQESFLPFRRKGNHVCAFHRNETIHWEPMEGIFAASTPLPPTALHYCFSLLFYNAKAKYIVK
jgi:hypothetical protein